MMMRTNDEEPIAVYLSAGSASGIMFICTGCQARMLGTTHCGTKDCHSICEPRGIGGPCPCCAQPVAVRELVGREMKLILAQ